MPPVIVDTSVWIEYFRLPDSTHGDRVEEMINEHEATLVGIVLAELLRGARNEAETYFLQEKLGAVPFLESSKSTWMRAGGLLVDLSRRGLAIPLADAVIAAQALESGHQLYTLDEHFRRVPGLGLYETEAK